MSEKDATGFIVPPPIVCLVCLMAGFGLDYLWPLPLLPRPMQYTVGFMLVVMGFVLFGWALKAFSDSKTSIDHRKPTRAIITGGPFRISRNPVYVSMTICFVGIAVTVDSIWILLMALPTVVILHHFVILREEAFLERKFGAEYLGYKAAVRRWV